MSALDRVQMSDLDEEQQQVAELIGLDNYKRLVSVFGGLSIYIPKADAWERMARDEQIREEFDGYNFKELAGRYGLTEVRIRSTARSPACASPRSGRAMSTPPQRTTS